MVMEEILIIGKGEPCVTLVQSLCCNRLTLNQSDEMAYYLKYEKGAWTEGFIPSSLDEFEQMKFALMKFDKVYIFTDKLSEALEKVNFFHELGTCKIFVISHTVKYSRIYRQLADFVITSLSDKSQYHWLINKDSFIC
jgi:hypothetical protein